jgi:ABC-type multidrug transport system fused ATPase/permease subunit
MLSEILKSFTLLDDRNRRFAWFTLVIILAATGLEALGVALVFPLIKMIGEPEALEAIPGLAELFQALQPLSHTDFMILFSVGVVALFIFKNLFLLFNVYWQNWFVFRNQASATRNLLYGYLASPYALHLQRNSAELIRNITEGLPPAFGAVMIGAFTLIAESLIVLSIGIILFAVNPAATFFAVLIMGSGMGLLYYLLRKKVRNWGWIKQELVRERLQFSIQALSGVKDLKVLNREGFFADIFHDTALNLARVMTKLRIAAEIPRLSIELVMVMTIIGAVLFTLARGDNEGDIMALLGLYGAASLRLVSSVNRTLPMLYTIQSVLPSLKVVYDDIDSFKDWEKDVESDHAVLQVAPEFETITLEDVSVSYSKEGSPALDRINLTIHRGESVGVAGSSGAGKTSLADLVLGLHAPVAGEIKVDGKSICTDSPEWRSRFGYVPQSVYLLDDTIRRNIAMGLPDALIDEDAINTAVRLAHLDEYLKFLPDGLDAMVGEHGVRLSGGQQQRIGIARALYRQPQILIMDEATSALDTETEKIISLAINGLKGKMTLLVIAHRLSTIMDCDRVVFLSRGEVAAVGTFEEVCAASAEFSRMVKLARLSPDAAIVEDINPDPA